MAESHGSDPADDASDESAATPGTDDPAGSGSLSEQLTPTPTAVVIDTNMWGEGDLDVKALTALAERLGRSDIEVWIPRQVVLEWARHATDRAQSIRAAWKTLHRAGQIEADGPPGTEVTQTAQDFLDRVANIQNVKVLQMRGDSAVAGIRDQILGNGPGTTKKDVRTGAVDSSWVRDAVAEAEDDLARIVFLTKNEKDVVKTIQAMGMDPDQLNVRANVRDLYVALFATSVATPAVEAKLAAHLIALSHWEDHDAHEPPSEGWLPLAGLDVRWSDAYTLPERFEVDSYFIEGSAILVGLGVVNLIEASSGGMDQSFTSLLEFEVKLLGSLSASGYTLDSDGVVQTSTLTLGEVLVMAPCTADIADLEISNVSVSDKSMVRSPFVRASETYDAWEEMISYLASLSGFDFDEERLADGEEVEITGAGRRTVRLVPRGGPYEEDWDLVLELFTSDQRQGEYEIVCRYDPDARVWDGPDSFDWEPPYYVSTRDGDPFAEPFSAVGSAWRWLMGD